MYLMISASMSLMLHLSHLSYFRTMLIISINQKVFKETLKHTNKAAKKTKTLYPLGTQGK